MPISTHFQDELDLVDNTRAFTEVIDGTYGENEFSVSGWELRAGSEAALNHAAERACYEMGYKWFTPYVSVRPGSLPAGGVTVAKTQHHMPYINFLINYSFGDAGGAVATAFERWTALMCAQDDRRPAGHTWATIIRANEAFFDANRSYFIDLNDNSGATVAESNGNLTFNLSDPTARAACLSICVTYLSTRLNSYNRAAFDPDDGDTWDTDTVVSFCNDVVNDLRANHNANAILTIYAYAGHRAAPSFDCPYIGVQVATGFNDLGIGYQALIEQWSARAYEVNIRGYGDIAAQNGFLPGAAGIRRNNFFSGAYPGYTTAGADGINMETSTNWAINIVSHWHMLRYARDGVNTYAQARDEVVTNAFGGDAKATELFDILAEPQRRPDMFNMNDVFQAIDQMQAGARKTELQQYAVVCESHLRLTEGRVANGEYANRGNVPAGIYFSRLEANLRRVAGMETGGGIHYYAYIRQLANANTTNNGRSDLDFDADAHWQRFPEAPTEAEFNTLRDELAALTSRPTALSYTDLNDLVVVDVTPLGNAASDLTPAPDFYTEGQALFVVVNDTSGSITVNHTYEDAYRGVKSTTFGPGVHTSLAEFNATTTWTGGMVFAVGFPTIRLDPAASGGSDVGNWWLYLPKIVKGRYKMTGDSRLSIHPETGPRLDITSTTPQDIEPGVVRMDRTQAINQIYLTNVNPYVSALPGKMLMPRSLALVEFPDLVIG